MLRFSRLWREVARRYRTTSVSESISREELREQLQRRIALQLRQRLTGEVRRNFTEANEGNKGVL